MMSPGGSCTAKAAVANVLLSCSPSEDTAWDHTINWGCNLLESIQLMLTATPRVAPEELNDAQDEEHITVEALYRHFLEGAVCIKWVYPAAAAASVS